jgi:hypothetical protein
MGSSEPLGTPSPKEGTDTQGFQHNHPWCPWTRLRLPWHLEARRKRGGLTEDELQAFNNMTEVVKDIAQPIRDNKPTDIHPDLYQALMERC